MSAITLNSDITTRDIINIMLGRKLRTLDVIAELEARFGACDRKLIRNRIANMCSSKSVDIVVIEKEDFDARVKYWHLKSVNDSYFRQSSLTRHIRRGLPAIAKERKKREYPRPKFTPDEINVCRMAKAVHHLWSTGEWIPPVLVDTGRKCDALKQICFPRNTYKNHSNSNFERATQWNMI
ncbi:hypothetical protein NFK58_12770 [Citrobacter portucalensis]|uniref:hypothetical protein n=1 Tax=Citrobacter portucalensis TaxID=1639133 RepID=UPI00242D153C|nr:hypothetical protein [Citrobacter portucalensis]WFZ22180.1 hypothetical protein NFK58_12770 [Citrobacter portucalensis]